jgi:hypothetical protein
MAGRINCHGGSAIAAYLEIATVRDGKQYVAGAGAGPALTNRFYAEFIGGRRHCSTYLQGLRWNFSTRYVHA